MPASKLKREQSDHIHGILNEERRALLVRVRLRARWLSRHDEHAARELVRIAECVAGFGSNGKTAAAPKR